VRPRPELDAAVSVIHRVVSDRRNAEKR